MTKFVFHDGVGIIGANKISLEAADGTGILLDFGFNFDIADQYFISPFLEPRRHQILYDGLKIGMLPLPKDILSGIYREDLYLYSQIPIQSEYGVDLSAPRRISHVLISHGHSDHIGGIKYLNPEIQVVTDRITLDVLRYYNKRYAAYTNFGEILSYLPYFQREEDGKRKRSRDRVQRNIFQIPPKKLVFLPNNPNFLVAYFPTDHSLIGAGAYLIYDCSTKTKFVYTGDLRMHGILRHQVEDFITAARIFKPDVLIIEGTRVGMNEPPAFDSEQAVEDKLKENFQQIHTENENAMVFFDCSRTDMYRMRSFYQAATSVNRTLVLPPAAYYLLHHCIQYKLPGFEDLPLNDILVYLPKRGWGCYEPEDYSKDRLLMEMFSKTITLPREMADEDEEASGDREIGTTIEKTIVDLDNSRFILAEEIQADPGKYLLFMDLFSLKELFDLAPTEESYYIISKSEWEDLQTQMYDEKKANWFKLFNIPESHILRAHCSGHISRDHIVELITKINPKKVFPIHSPDVERFKELDIPDSIELILPERGKSYEV